LFYSSFWVLILFFCCFCIYSWFSCYCCIYLRFLLLLFLFCCFNLVFFACSAFIGHFTLLARARVMLRFIDKLQSKKKVKKSISEEKSISKVTIIDYQRSFSKFNLSLFKLSRSLFVKIFIFAKMVQMWNTNYDI